MNLACELVLPTADDTARIGAALAKVVAAGDVIALYGQLGAGKTSLVRALARGLGVAADEPVVSPTFVLIREYEGSELRLYHIDAYRLHDAAELIDAGLIELREDPIGLIAIEWADRAPQIVPDDAWRITLSHAPNDQRHVRISHPDQGRLAPLASLVVPGN